MPSIEMVRMVSSGTEASMSADPVGARVTPAATVIVKFAGCYHGHVDSAARVQAGSSATDARRAQQSRRAEGLRRNDTLVPAATTTSQQVDDKRSRRTATEIAGVLLEPVAGNMGLVTPSSDFRRVLRQLTQKHGARC